MKQIIDPIQWVKLHIHDFQGRCADRSMQFRYAYFMAHYLIGATRAPLADDIKTIVKIMRLEGHEQDVADMFETCFVKTDAGWITDSLADTIATYDAKTLARKAAGRAGGYAKAAASKRQQQAGNATAKAGNGVAKASVKMANAGKRYLDIDIEKEEELSVANATDNEVIPKTLRSSGANAAKVNGPVDIDKDVFDLGVAVAGPGNKALIAKLRNQFGAPTILSALKATVNAPKRPDEIAGYLTAVCQRLRDEAIRADESWAIKAGFQSADHAKNHDCYRRNAHEFRDGKRIAGAA